MLTITAGRVFRISPPSDESKAIHHTSPRRGLGTSAITSRFDSDVADQPLGPIVRLALALLIGGHCRVSGSEVIAEDMRTGKIIQKPTDSPPADDRVQAFVDFGLDRDRKLLHHWRLLYV
ncbi:MAG: hypothetical protein ABI369_05880 [Acetobacteraceae bacterium]